MKKDTNKQEPHFMSEAGNAPQAPAQKSGFSVYFLIIACVALGVLFLVLTVRFIGSYRNLQDTLAAQESQIAALEGDPGIAPTDGDETSGENDAEADRTARDDKLAWTMLDTLLTWDSLDSYNAVRSSMMEDYSAAEGSSLLTSFMPATDEDTLGNLNMRFEDAVTYQINTSGQKISYFALCEVSNQVNENTGYGSVGVLYTIDGDGNVSDISAYTLAGQVPEVF